MRTRTALIAFFVLAAPSASAQVAGLPVFGAGVPSGPTLSADLGFANEDAGSGKAYGVTGAIALGPLGVSATLSKFALDEGDAQTWYGGMAALRLFGGGALPVTVDAQAGIATTSVDIGGPEDIRLTSIPVGIAIRAKVGALGPSTTLWAAPRMQFRNSSGAADEHLKDFAFSLGADVALGGGLLVRAAYDRIQAEDATPGVFSVGVGYRLPTPGM